MAKDGLMYTPFEHPTVPTPSPGEGTTFGIQGGAQWPMENGGKSGLVTSPYDNPCVTAPEGKETPNSFSGLATQPYTTDVKDGPAPWSQAAVAPGVASPAVPLTPIDRMKG